MSKRENSFFFFFFDALLCCELRIQNGSNENYNAKEISQMLKNQVISKSSTQRSRKKFVIFSSFSFYQFFFSPYFALDIFYVMINFLLQIRIDISKNIYNFLMKMEYIISKLFSSFNNTSTSNFVLNIFFCQFYFYYFTC